MNDTYSEQALDWMDDYICMLPLELTMDSPSRTLRLLGLVWFLAWLPVVFMCVFPMLFLMLMGIVEDVWRGPQ